MTSISGWCSLKAGMISSFQMARSSFRQLSMVIVCARAENARAMGTSRMTNLRISSSTIRDHSPVKLCLTGSLACREAGLFGLRHLKRLLDGAGGKTSHQVALHEARKQQSRQRNQHRQRAHVLPVDLHFTESLCDDDRHRLGVQAGEDERERELV